MADAETARGGRRVGRRRPGRRAADQPAGPRAATSRASGNRLRAGDLGTLPVVVGLVVICAVFYAREPTFLSSRNLVNITQFAAPIGIIALGIVLVLLLGRDRPVGRLGQRASRRRAWPCCSSTRASRSCSRIWPAPWPASPSGSSTAVLYTRRRRAQLRVLPGRPAGLPGRAALRARRPGHDQPAPATPACVEFARAASSPAGSPTCWSRWSCVRLPRLAAWRTAARARPPACPPPCGRWCSIKAVAARRRARLPHLLPQHRPRLRLPVVAVLRCWSCVMDLRLRKTRWGRHVFAVGGNEEAARRSGIKVDRIYLSVFALCSTLAALGGLMAPGS